MVAISAIAFVAIFFFGVPFPLIVLSAAVVGYIGGKLYPETFVVIKGHQATHPTTDSGAPILRDDAVATRPTISRTLRVLTVWLLIWWGGRGDPVVRRSRQRVCRRSAVLQ
jgi:chromate transporter